MNWPRFVSCSLPRPTILGNTLIMGNGGRTSVNTPPPSDSSRPIVPDPSPARLSLAPLPPPPKAGRCSTLPFHNATTSDCALPLPGKTPNSAANIPPHLPPSPASTVPEITPPSLPPPVPPPNPTNASSVTSPAPPTIAPPSPAPRQTRARLSVSIPSASIPPLSVTNNFDNVISIPHTLTVGSCGGYPPPPPPQRLDNTSNIATAISGSVQTSLTANNLVLRSPVKTQAHKQSWESTISTSSSSSSMHTMASTTVSIPTIGTSFSHNLAATAELTQSCSESILQTPTELEQKIPSYGDAPLPPSKMPVQKSPPKSRKAPSPPVSPKSLAASAQLSPTDPNLERSSSNRTLGRAKSLVRPERHPTIRRGLPREPTATHQRTTRMLKPESHDRPSWWRVMSWVLTFWALPPLIRWLSIGKRVDKHEYYHGVGDIPPPKGEKRWIDRNTYVMSDDDTPLLDKDGKPVLDGNGMPQMKKGKIYQITTGWNQEVIQAWREKVALCSIVVLLCAILAFITFGLQTALCPAKAMLTYAQVAGVDGFSAQPYVYNVRGTVFDMKQYLTSSHPTPISSSVASSTAGYDISALFPAPGTSCQSLLTTIMPTFGCSDVSGKVFQCHTWAGYQNAIQAASWQSSANTPKILGYILYDWLDMERRGNEHLMVYSQYVLDMTRYYAAGVAFLGNDVHAAINRSLTTDASKSLARFPGAGACLTELFMVGYINTMSVGCLTLQIFLYVSLFIILALVAIKFILALYFGWFMSRKLGMLKKRKGPTQIGQSNPRMGINKKEGAVSASQQFGGWLDTTTTPTPVPEFEDNGHGARESTPSFSDTSSDLEGYYGDDLGTVLLVTCYSEGEEGLRTTLNSLASTIYPDENKMIMVVADGLVKGSGNDRTTPEIVCGMVEMDTEYPLPPPSLSYLAIADGARRHNMAQVYAGWYTYEHHRVAIMVVVKCGTPEEHVAAKPGNRGKRDSQLIVMNFFRHAFFDDPIPPLEYDLSAKLTHLTGGTPDKFEILLMVDADTNVAPDSLSRMVAVMAYDPLVMGLCGETRIMNKAESWVSRIQVFEYYLSHHLSKAFESVFGEVTCLPGCFCMYRIKAPKGDTWVPVLINPDIVEVYSENIVDTLHKKNLLLLGEDRFLTTLMLRAFPTRKLMFVPKAYCKTTVPAEFKVLLSQRRRWINSTIHNLLELVLVRELCGTFCVSMQAVILLELIGTVTLPAAITFTTILLLQTLFSTITHAEIEWIPLMLLGAILGLPAFLILFASRRWAYIYWMVIYLMSLHVWNLVLPAYAFWHFDDFSWGQTRQVAGEKKGEGHGGEGGAFDDAGVPHKLWVEWEIEARRKKKSKLRCSKTSNYGPAIPPKVVPPVPTTPTSAPNPIPTPKELSRMVSRREIHHPDFSSHIAMSQKRQTAKVHAVTRPQPCPTSPGSISASLDESGTPHGSIMTSPTRSLASSEPRTSHVNINQQVGPSSPVATVGASLLKALSRTKSLGHARSSVETARSVHNSSSHNHGAVFVLPPPIPGPSPAAHARSRLDVEKSGNGHDLEENLDAPTEDIVYVGVLPVTLEKSRLRRARTLERSATLTQTLPME
ncbi:chitin synthase [Synchytrium endobioticum]|uniref:chitin synthase n=1 Tax=Synchytrium endobioticum TaxID=286115 RepID=A0A507CS06_9FUNG|nr:chitin synthase [Synchytrium endobioticum]